MVFCTNKGTPYAQNLLLKVCEHAREMDLLKDADLHQLPPCYLCSFAGERLSQAGPPAASTIQHPSMPNVLDNMLWQWLTGAECAPG